MHTEAGASAPPVDTFKADGHAALRGAFSAESAERMSGAIWRYIEAHTAVRRDDTNTWPTAWLPISFKKLKRHSSFRAVLDAPVVRQQLDAIFGESGWIPSKSGAQILCTFPNTAPDAWRVPNGLWHMDASFQSCIDPPRAVKLFSVVEPLPAHNGATMVITGTPRLQAEYAQSVGEELRAGKTANWHRFLSETDPWLATLVSNRPTDRDDPNRNEMFAASRRVGASEVSVRELTGNPGDVHVTHINLFHAASPNAGAQPRIVVTHVVTNASHALP